MTFNDRYLHQVEIIVAHEIHVGYIEEIAIVSRNIYVIAGRITERQFCAARYHLHLRQAAQFGHRTVAHLGIDTACIAINQVLVSVTGVTRNHRIILPADGDQQRHQIGRGNELHEQ